MARKKNNFNRDRISTEGENLQMKKGKKKQR